MSAIITGLGNVHGRLHSKVGIEGACVEADCESVTATTAEELFSLSHLHSSVLFQTLENSREQST